MNDEALRALVQERWTALETEQTTGERRLRFSPLPVVAADGSLAVAVDHDGHRHVLIPVQTHRKVRPGLDGPVLRLRKRALEDEESYQAYADLACLRDDMSDLFTRLVVDVLRAVAERPENPVKALYGVLDRWKALFRAQGAPLRPDQLTGLFGELLLLERLLEKDSSAHAIWLGPKGHCHDFRAGPTAVEVKSASNGVGRRPRVHGLDQLEAPEGGALCLLWFRLNRCGPTDGTSFPDLVDSVLRLCDDEGALLGLLAEAGYRLSDADHYRDVRFVTAEERWYRVGPEFPRLTGRQLAVEVPPSVLDIEYTIDLSGEVPAPLLSADVAQFVDKLIQESV